MDDRDDTAFTAAADGLHVEVVAGLHAASLRYFDGAGSFGGALREALDQPLPQPQRVARCAAGPGAEILLAWRSPTETLLLCSDAAMFADLERRLALAIDGCMVDQTGGIRVLRVRGLRARDLLQRLGAATLIPSLGEARGGRLAEVQVLSACAQDGEFLLCVERVYAAHLAEWIRATVADFS